MILSASLTTFSLVLYIICGLFVPVVIWMLFSGMKVQTTFNKYNNVKSKKGISGAEAAREILDKNGLYTVSIKTCAGKLTDHYDPSSNTVFLSEASANSSSIAAIGVAAHEVGHAIQYAEEYAPVKIRAALVPVLNFSSKLTFPLILISMLFEILAYTVSFSMKISNFFLILALLCYIFYCAFTFITLPTEYNASKRAKKSLAECGILDDSEIAQTAKVLNAAATTYLASFAMSLIQVARLLFILVSRRNNNND